MFKKTVAALFLILAAVVTGCASPLTVEQVVEKTTAAAEEVQSYRAGMSMAIVANGEIDGESMDMDVSMDASMAVDQANRKMSMQMQVNMEGGDPSSVPGDLQNTEMDMYIIGNEMYMKVDMPVVGSTWMKTDLPEGSWDGEDLMAEWVGQATLAQQLELLEAAQPELLGEEKVDGVVCYKIKLTPDLEQLMSLLMNQSAIPDMDMSETDIDMASLFQEMSMVEWISKDTFLLYKSEVDIVMSLSPETVGEPDVQGEATIEMHLVMTASDYNKPLDIVLPEEAQNAISMPYTP